MKPISEMSEAELNELCEAALKAYRENGSTAQMPPTWIVPKYGVVIENYKPVGRFYEWYEEFLKDCE